MLVSDNSRPPAAWYPDPSVPGQLRWWDGALWTEHTHQEQAAAVKQVAPATAPAKAAKKTSSWRIAKLTDEEYEAGLVQRLDAALEAYAEGDIESAEGLTYHLTAYAEGRRGKKGLADAQQRLAEGKRKLGVKTAPRIGVVSSEGFMESLQRTGKFLPVAGRAIGGMISVYADRIVQDGSAHPIDEYTQATVFLDGQKQITTRPSLTALAVFSPLPGSALGPALAMPKKETHDLRIAEFQVIGPGWSCSVAISPDRTGSARALAARINAMADEIANKKIREYEASSAPAVTAAAPGGAPDIVSQLERIVEMERAGSLTPEQAEALKTKLITGA